jgi:ferric-dicitrate binding protein FerR (iron transport regulator)
MTMDPHDWEPQEPSAGFADRVMDRALAEAAATPSLRERRAFRPRVAALTVGLGLAAGIALAVGSNLRASHAHGEATAKVRTEVHVGDRAIAVLEPGAHIAWDGDQVTEPAGDVFFRVEPGRAFDVHTPAGDVEVLGTCFRVRVDERSDAETKEQQMNGRDVKAGVIGAALSAAAFVSVYEGKVALSHASERVVLTAGESARAGASGVTRTGGAEGAGSEAMANAADSKEADPLVAANANLTDSVRDYKRRLEALEAQKATIAKQLSDAQDKLALAQNDGQAAPKKSPYDLTQDDWKKLAEDGQVVAKLACTDPARWTPSPAQLSKLGLAPGDAQPIHDVLQQSSQRVWATIRPLCIQALQGDAKTADKLGEGTCASLVADVAKINGEDTEEEIRAVAEMRAGLRPYDAKALGSYGAIMYVESGESKAMEQQLAQSIGPDDARAFIYGDEGCWSTHSHGVGPRAALPPK